MTNSQGFCLLFDKFEAFRGEIIGKVQISLEAGTPPRMIEAISAFFLGLINSLQKLEVLGSSPSVLKVNVKKTKTRGALTPDFASGHDFRTLGWSPG